MTSQSSCAVHGCCPTPVLPLPRSQSTSALVDLERTPKIAVLPNCPCVNLVEIEVSQAQVPLCMLASTPAHALRGLLCLCAVASGTSSQANIANARRHHLLNCTLNLISTYGHRPSESGGSCAISDVSAAGNLHGRTLHRLVGTRPPAHAR